MKTTFLKNRVGACQTTLTELNVRVTSLSRALFLLRSKQEGESRVSSMKVYFCGSIRGGRADVDTYRRIVTKLQSYGTVLTEHVSNRALDDIGESTHRMVQSTA